MCGSDCQGPPCNTSGYLFERRVTCLETASLLPMPSFMKGTMLYPSIGYVKPSTCSGMVAIHHMSICGKLNRANPIYYKKEWQCSWASHVCRLSFPPQYVFSSLRFSMAIAAARPLGAQLAQPRTPKEKKHICHACISQNLQHWYSKLLHNL